MNEHVCGTRYKALMASSLPHKVLTVGDDRASLSFQTPDNQHPITLQSLFSDNELHDDSKYKYWRSLGGKYLTLGNNKQLTLSVSILLNYVVSNK